VNRIMKQTGVVVLVVAATNHSRGAEYAVEYTDNDRLHWTGVVDTTANTLAIDTWEVYAHSRPFWRPDLDAGVLAADGNLWLFDAVIEDGSEYDVPDNWDGQIANNWAFLSRHAYGEIQWLDGNPTAGLDVYTMWGGSHGQAAPWGVFPTNERFQMLIWSNDFETSVPDDVSVTLIPEPSSLLLGLAGLGLLGANRLGRRRKR
jgi:hypothetical protein